MRAICYLNCELDYHLLKFGEGPGMPIFSLLTPLQMETYAIFAWRGPPTATAPSCASHYPQGNSDNEAVTGHNEEARWHNSLSF